MDLGSLALGMSSSFDSLLHHAMGPTGVLSVHQSLQLHARARPQRQRVLRRAATLRMTSAAATTWNEGWRYTNANSPAVSKGLQAKAHATPSPLSSFPCTAAHSAWLGMVSSTMRVYAAAHGCTRDDVHSQGVEDTALVPCIPCRTVTAPAHAWRGVHPGVPYDAPARPALPHT